MAKKYLDDTGMSYFWGKLKSYFQEKLVSGTNIKTINSTSLLGSGDIELPSPADYVVEEGTSGKWRYRKWNGGIAECWCLTDSTSHAMTTQLGNQYWCEETYNFPSGLFTSIDSAQANRTGSGHLVYISINNITTSTIKYYCVCTSSATLTFGILFDVKGRWK